MRELSKREDCQWWALVVVLLLGSGRAAVGVPTGHSEGRGGEAAWQHTRVEREAGAALPELPTAPSEEPVEVYQPGTLRRRHSERQWGTEVAMVHPGEVVAGAVSGRVWEKDGLESLLGAAGLERVEEYPPRERALAPEAAMRLMGRLLGKPLTLGRYPPRQAANHLLLEVVRGGAEVGREELLRRVERYRQVAVLRPDGYLAWVQRGETQQKVGPVEWREGAFRAGNFELGRFYQARGGVYRHADERLEPVQEPVLGEVYDDGDVVNRGVEGAVDAGLHLVDALGQALSFPLETLAGLQHLPRGVVALIDAYPGYRERFQYMSRGEQLRELSRLTTLLVVTVGTAGEASGAAGMGVSVPVLTVSAQGALAVELVAVPVGQGVAVLGVGAGAVAVFSQNTGSPTRSNGQAVAPKKANPKAFADWAEKAPKRTAPSSSPAGRYQVKYAGPEEINVSGGGKQVWADGARTSDAHLLEAKHVENTATSPYIPGSGCPEAVRSFVRNELLNELRRYAAVILDPGTPAVGLEIITNNARAASYFEALIREAAVPGRVVMRP